MLAAAACHRTGPDSPPPRCRGQPGGSMQCHCSTARETQEGAQAHTTHTGTEIGGHALICLLCALTPHGRAGCAFACCRRTVCAECMRISLPLLPRTLTRLAA